MNDNLYSNYQNRTVTRSGDPKNKVRALVLVAGVVVASVILYLVFRNSGVQMPENDKTVAQRTDTEIISELTGIQSIINADAAKNGRYLVETKLTKVRALKTEITALANYDNIRLQGDDEKDFLYQSDAEGTIYVLFATLPEGNRLIKASAPPHFEMPKGYNYWIGKVK